MGMEKELNVIEDGNIWVKALDVDGTGKISYADFTQGVLAMAAENAGAMSHSALIQLMFGLMDTDGSGGCDINEIKDFMKVTRNFGLEPRNLSGLGITAKDSP